MKSYLLSTLRAEFGASRQEDFVRAAPHAWLLWAPGAWQPPLHQTGPLPPLGAPAGEPIPMEALAIELVPLTHPVVLGRADDCDLVINDGTLSARHVQFHPLAGGWAVEDLGSTNGTRADGDWLEPGALRPLHDGTVLGLGHVTVLFFSSEGLWSRLREP